MKGLGRRLLMVGLYALIFSVLTVGAPLFAIAAAIYDRRQDNRGASLRLAAFAWVYLLAELGGVALAQLIWLRWRLGGDDEGYRGANVDLQRRWISALLRALRRLFELDLVVEGAEHALPGPVVLLIRHTSFIDTLLPGQILGSDLGMRIRYILKRELRFDPCLDIIGDRLPNHFLDRNGETSEELSSIERLARGLDDDEAVLLYPEGTRFTEAKRARVLDRLRERDPERYARASTLTRVLPPRPGGALTLLRSGHDVVFFAHSGLEGFASWTHLLSGALVGSTIRAWLWRVPARELPGDDRARLAWLDAQWAKVDRLAATAAAPAQPSRHPPPS